MEEFVTEEEEPWYDQQDLEQGKTPSSSSSSSIQLLPTLLLSPQRLSSPKGIISSKCSGTDV